MFTRRKVLNWLGVFFITAFAFSIFSVQVFAATPQERIDDAVGVLKEMAEKEDAWRMGDLLEEAWGVAIFPKVVKAGLVIGGHHGEGFFLKRDPSTGRWYGPNFVSVTGASWGLQIGVQSIGLVLVVINEDGIQGFMGDNVKLSGDLSVAAGPEGRHTEAGTDSRLEASIYSYSITKGAFAGMMLEGAAITVDENANTVYWGVNLSAESALDRPASDVRIRPVMNELEDIMAIRK